MLAGFDRSSATETGGGGSDGDRPRKRLLISARARLSWNFTGAITPQAPQLWQWQEQRSGPPATSQRSTIAHLLPTGDFRAPEAKG